MTRNDASSDPKLRHLIRDDLRRGDFFDTIRSDYYDLRELFLDDDRKARLATMRPLRRWLKTAGWLLKALVLKLTPARRLLLLVAIVFMFTVDTHRYDAGNVQVSFNFGFVSMLLFVFILMLELKDKLLAKEELQAGRAIQEQMLPEESPKVEGWSLWLFTRTANDVGGDLVDFQRLADDRYACTLADVAGKGLNAALHSVKLQATLRALSTEHESLSDLASRINRLFRSDGIRKLFASLVYLEFHSADGKVRYVNAGHFPPLLVRGNSVTELEKGGPALGLMEQVEFRELAAELGPGDCLLCYSDGVTEAKNETGAFFGQERFRSLLPPLAGLDAPAMGERIVRTVAQFVGKARIYDDLSLIILKRQPL